MTDLEHQLRECLSRHADDAVTAPALLTGAKARSAQLGRRGQVGGALAVAAVTAGVAVGATALASSPATSHPASLQAKPTASSSPTAAASKRPVDAHLVLFECKSGFVPKLGARHGNLLENVGTPSSKAIHRQIRLAQSGKQPVSIYYLRLVGHHSGGRLIAIEQVKRNGHRGWTLSFEHSPESFTSHRANFLGCAPPRRS